MKPVNWLILALVYCIRRPSNRHWQKAFRSACSIQTGLVNRVLPLLAGKYLVRLARVKGRDRLVTIKSGELVNIEAWELAATKPPPLMPR